MQASQEGHSDVVDVLLDHNANINHQSNVSWIISILHYTIHYLDTSLDKIVRCDIFYHALVCLFQSTRVPGVQ